MAEEQPLISIITITRNRASLIYKCIESIQKQTYKNYEHIIVDGNSTDNTSDVVRKYCFADNKIRYIKLDYCGPIKQQLQGFMASKGEYITFLDDDDEYLPNNLEVKLELFLGLDDKYGLIYGPMDYFNFKNGQYLYTHEALIEGGKEILPQVIKKAYVSGTPSIMYRRSALADIGGTYISGIGNEMSDWALAAKAIARGWKVKKYDKSLVKIYVNHDAERMTNYTVIGTDGARKMILFHNYFLTEYADVIKKNPHSGIYHYRALISANIRLKNWKNAFHFYMQLLKSQMSLKNIAYLFYVIIKVNKRK